jgi:signal transduction histidine kinase
VARIESGKLDYCFEAVDLRALCEDVLARFTEQRHVPRLLPGEPGAPPLLVYCDASRVEQVLINFLTNAFKYGGDKPAEVRLSRNEENFLLTVKDFGLGIAKEKQQAIFDRFERAISYEYISGLGLGLYIAKQIAEAHGGRISLLSAPGEGSEFTFEIPARRAAS